MMLIVEEQSKAITSEMESVAPTDRYQDHDKR